MFGIGATEMVLILVVALLVVGPKRLPGLARSLGRSMAEFRRHANDLRHTLQEADVSESLKEAAKAPDSYRIAPPDLDPSGESTSATENDSHADTTGATPRKPPAVENAAKHADSHEPAPSGEPTDDKGEERGG